MRPNSFAAGWLNKLGDGRHDGAECPCVLVIGGLAKGLEREGCGKLIKTLGFSAQGRAASKRSQKQSTLVIPRPALSARNLLAASGEGADSSRDKAALRNDNCLGFFKLHHYVGLCCLAWNLRKFSGGI